MDTETLTLTTPVQQIHARFSLYETTRITCYVKDEKNQWANGEGCRVKLQPVQGEPFGSATPAGSLEMVIANQAASAVFQAASLGQQFDVLISPVPAPEPVQA